MLVPSIFSRNLFDEVFDPRMYGYDRHSSDLMKTDVKETAQGYELAIELPGVKKEDLKAELKDGYLTVGATTSRRNDEKGQDGSYIRRERFVGSFSRSFYVGEAVTQEDIRAKFEDGILLLQVPKKDQLPAIEEKKYITIE